MKITTCTDRTLLTSCNLDRFDYQLDTYIGCEHYCYYCYVLRQAETNWVQEIQVHRDLRKRLADERNYIVPQQVYIRISLTRQNLQLSQKIIHTG